MANRRARHYRREAMRNLLAAIALLVAGSSFAGWLSTTGAPSCLLAPQRFLTQSGRLITFPATRSHSDEACK